MIEKYWIIVAILAMGSLSCSPRTRHSQVCNYTDEIRMEKAEFLKQCISQFKTTNYKASDEEEHDLGGWVRACDRSAYSLFEKTDCKEVIEVVEAGGPHEWIDCEIVSSARLKKACEDEARGD